MSNNWNVCIITVYTVFLPTLSYLSSQIAFELSGKVLLKFLFFNLRLNDLSKEGFKSRQSYPQPTALSLYHNFMPALGFSTII